MLNKIFHAILFIVLVLPSVSYADVDPSTLPLPRFVSISPGEANARSGPSTKYPILWVYQHRHLPVEVTNQYEHWRKVRDMDGQGGWIHKSLLSGERYGIINSSRPVSLHKNADESEEILAMIEPRVVVKLLECQENWCKVQKADFYGWIKRNFIWGIYQNEQIN